MFGLEQIKAMNANPEAHAVSELSDGQERRNGNSDGRAYWSQEPGDINALPPSETGVDVYEAGTGHGDDWGVRLNEDAFRPVGSDSYADFDVVSGGGVVHTFSRDRMMQAMGKIDTVKVDGMDAHDIIPTVLEQIKGAKPHLPPLYFDAVQLQTVLDGIADRATLQATQLRSAINMLHSATNEIDAKHCVKTLDQVMTTIRHRQPVLDIALLIAMLETEVSKASPTIPDKGNPYRPRFGLDHAMHPIKGILAKLRLATHKLANMPGV